MVEAVSGGWAWVTMQLPTSKFAEGCVFGIDDELTPSHTPGNDGVIMQSALSKVTALVAALVLTACAASPTAGTGSSAPPITTQDGGEMPTPAVPEDCRFAMSILPVGSDDVTPNAWAFALRYELVVDHSADIAFVGITDSSVTVYPAATTTDARAVVDQAAEVVGADGFDVGSWTLGAARSWNFDELCAAFDALRAEMDAGAVVGLWPQDSGSLQVEVLADRARDSEVLATLLAQYPDMITVTTVDELVEAESHRSNDTTGFNAGIAIQTFARNDWYACTAAFKIQNGYGSFLLTAAHCSAVNNQTVRNGTTMCWAGLSGNAYVGQTGSRILGNGGDFAVIQGSSGTTGRMWAGTSCVGSGEVGVLGSVASSGGAAVGFSGHRTGQRTGTVVSSATGCSSVNYSAPVTPVGAAPVPIIVCNLYTANATPDSPLTQNGDSGGPVFAYTSGSSVYGAGVHCGSRPGASFYTSLPAILYLYSASIVTG